ncbi:MAG: hypothetical protein ACTH8A_18390, partial [Serratia proteamaculans]
WLKKRFTGANDNDYYCDAFRGEYQPLVPSLRRHDIAHIASKYYLASSGAGFFFACFPPLRVLNKSTVNRFKTPSNFLNRAKSFLRFHILLSGLDCKKH